MNPPMNPPKWLHHVRASIRELKAYDVPPADSGQARLHANECAERWPTEVYEAVARTMGSIELERYPDCSGRGLRELLGATHECDPQRVVLGNGSDEVITLLLTTLSQRGGAVVIPTPTFVMYGHSARVLGIPVRGVPVDDDFQLREAALREALPGAALCFLARPNNPTAALWDRDLIWRLVHDHPETVFVVDEAYAAYAPGESMWRHDGPSNYVHMGTLSKVGAAALRVGYCISPPALAAELNKVRHPYNVSATSLAVASLLLTQFGQQQAQMVERTLSNRRRLRAVFGAIGARVYPSAANFVVARLSPAELAQNLRTHLANVGVLIKDLSGFPRLAGCIRASVGTDAELDRLEAGLRAWDANRTAPARS